MCRRILNKTGNANLGVLINLLNIWERNKTLEEFSGEDTMSMINDLADHCVYDFCWECISIRNNCIHVLLHCIVFFLLNTMYL